MGNSGDATFEIRDPSAVPDLEPGFFERRAAEQAAQARTFDPTNRKERSRVAKELRSRDWAVQREAAIAELQAPGDEHRQDALQVILEPIGAAIGTTDAHVIERARDAVVAAGRVIRSPSDHAARAGSPVNLVMAVSAVIAWDTVPPIVRSDAGQVLRAVPGWTPGPTAPMAFVARHVVEQVTEAAEAGRITLSGDERRNLEEMARQIAAQDAAPSPTAPTAAPPAAPPPTPVAPAVAASWQPDPRGRHEYRYWDGTRWTEHVSDAGAQGTDPL